MANGDDRQALWLLKPGVALSGVQVSLQRLVKLLQVKGRSAGFDLSSAIVPMIDVSRLIEQEFGGELAAAEGDEYIGYSQAPGVNPGPPLQRNAVALCNPVGSKVVLECREIAIQWVIGSTLPQVEWGQFDGVFTGAVVGTNAGGWNRRADHGLGQGVLRTGDLDVANDPAEERIFDLYEPPAASSAHRVVLLVPHGPRMYITPGKSHAIRAGAVAGNQFKVRYSWRESAL